MARKQTRRTVSVRGDNYRRFREWSQETGIPMAAQMDRMIERLCDAADIQDPGVDPPSLAPPRKLEELAGAHFTF